MSTTSCIFLIDESPITWLCKKQSCVALSSVEAEDVSIAHANQELQWLISLPDDLDMPLKLPIKLFETAQIYV